MSAITATGVAITGGGNIYVPYTLGGETVEAEAVPGRHPRPPAIASRSRSQAWSGLHRFCPHFGVCGGCAIQHWDAAPYSAWKRELVATTLAQAGIDCDVAPLVDAHGAGRRRITLHARMGTHDVLKVGYAAAGDARHHPDRPLPDPGPPSERRDRGGLGARRAADFGRKPLDIQITATESGLDVDVRGSGPLSTALITRLSRIAEEHRLARLTRHGELVLMRTPPVISIGAAQVTLPPGSFLQATVAGEETLAALVSEHCKRAKHIADLFCGVGPFALRLAAKVAGNRLSTATPAQSRRCRRRRPRHPD
jgi:23S rRNA (uracil1939-C5)-methyltransferase